MDVTIPKVGLTVETVEVLHWHCAAGDAVVAGEPLVDLSADKADIEVPAPAGGTLGALLLAVGDSAAPGAVLTTIAVDGEVTEPVVAAPDAAAAALPVADAVVAVAAPPSAPPAAANGRLRASPVARRTAQRLGIDLHALDGSGPRGRIVRADVEAAATAPAPNLTAVSAPEPAPAADGAPTAPATSGGASGSPASPSAPSAPADDLVPVRWTAARRATAKLMARSAATVAPVTLHRRAPAELAAAAVKRLKRDGIHATFNHAVVAAVARALPSHPALNAVWDGDTLLASRRVHVGIAVDVDGDLDVAVVADADRLDVIGLCTAATAAVARTRSRTPGDGAAPRATFSVSNLGMLGVEQFTPIITPPQVAVLGVGAVVDGRCHLSLTFDHRAVDGAPSARFLAEVAERIGGFDGG